MGDMANRERNAGEVGERSLSISNNAFGRLEALRRSIKDAAQRLTKDADYPDFFVEGSGPPWHERWPEVITGRRDFSEERMLHVDRLAQEDYPDFFVEGSGPPWHERWPEVISGRLDPSIAQQRMNVLRRLSVFQAFQRMREDVR